MQLAIIDANISGNTAKMWNIDGFTRKCDYLSTSCLITFLVALEQFSEAKVGNFHLSWTVHCNNRQLLFFLIETYKSFKL